MNFFEQQDKARRQTRWLVTLFGLAVLGIIVAVNVLVLGLFGYGDLAQPGATGGSGAFLRANLNLIAATSLITGAIIGLASAFRTLQLRSGGGDIARALGGTLVEPDTRDPLRRRLHNVVEEMAIASGIPVPEVYVMEHEQGINAFAAGYSPSDAAVAVTRGTLEHLDRDELQGVIAHEFAHIFNGDMRLNIRLIGVLFGILIISIIGRRLLFSARLARDSRNAAPAVFIGLAVLVIGYIGLFFGRWIKAAVSRQREYLADASAVQFTRQPDGVAGALKKIAALSASSYMVADAEEVGHMLFARGMGYQLFATHPPLESRIKAIDPKFDKAEIKALAESLSRHAQARRAEAEAEAQARRAAAESQQTPEQRGPGGLPLDAERLAEQIGQPGLNQVFIAAALAASLPGPLERAAHSDEWAMELIACLLLSGDDNVREEQLLLIARQLGEDGEQQTRSLLPSVRGLKPEQRLPLMEMAFPVLRRRPARELIDFMKLVEALVAADGKVDVFEYALARLLNQHIEESLNPSRAGAPGSAKLASRLPAAAELLSILSHHGRPEQPDVALAAAAEGIRKVADQSEADKAPAPLEAIPADWPARLDKALAGLDKLRPGDKERLLKAMVAVVQFDDQVITAELELLRAICGLLHIPLPVVATDSGA
ncbi:MAG: M48 family metallopeptidase [Wenzhouxiangella sp.]